jgi:hypothetical protein
VFVDIFARVLLLLPRRVFTSLMLPRAVSYGATTHKTIYRRSAGAKYGAGFRERARWSGWMVLS